MNFLYNKPTRCANFSIFILFWKETLHVSDSSSVHHQEFFTVHTANLYMSYRFADGIRMELEFHPNPACKLSAKLYDINNVAVCTMNNS